MNKSDEIRSGAPVELRQVEDDANLVRVGGYAAIFDEWANIGTYFQERIAPGAFDGRLGDDVVFLVDHAGLPLARTSSGTLKLSIDQRGLAIEADLDTLDPDVARVVPKLRRGDLSKMSIAFRVEREEWDESGDIPRRTITRLSLLRDVSVVTSPAYAGTDIGLRSLEAHRASQREPIEARARRARMTLALAAMD